MDINLNNDNHKELLTNICNRAEEIDINLNLPDAEADMQGLTNLRNSIFCLKESVVRYKKLISDDSNTLKDAGNELENAELYNAEKIKQSSNKQ